MITCAITTFSKKRYNRTIPATYLFSFSFYLVIGIQFLPSLHMEITIIVDFLHFMYMSPSPHLDIWWEPERLSLHPTQRKYAFYELRNLTKMKDTTETVGQRNSSETAQQNFLKLCSNEGHNFYRKCWFDPFEVQFISPFLSNCPSLMLGIPIHCIQHSLYTAFSSNVGALGMWACSLFLSFILVFVKFSFDMWHDVTWYDMLWQDVTWYIDD